jgi:hypothetical protein
MRSLTRLSTAACTLAIYLSYWLSEPKGSSWVRLAESFGISHDSVNRFLQRENYTSQDLFHEVKGTIDREGGTVSVDDTVLDKPYSKIHPLINYFWSGNHKRVVLGVNLITLYYTDPQGLCVPLSYRLYDKTEGKTKNDYFQEMLEEVLALGVRPARATGDRWLASLGNFKLIRNKGLGFLFAIENNRQLSAARGEHSAVQRLDIPQEGRTVYLPKLGYVKVFRTYFKDEARHFIAYHPEGDRLQAFTRSDFESLHDQHYGIEAYHRILKQVCNVEHFQVRTEVAIRNHIFCALCGYIQLEIARIKGVIANHYEFQRTLFLETIGKFIREHVDQMVFVNAPPRLTVNA